MLDRLHPNTKVIPTNFFSSDYFHYYAVRYFSLDTPLCAKIIRSHEDRFHLTEIVAPLKPSYQQALTALKIASYATIVMPLLVFTACIVAKLKMDRNPQPRVNNEFFYENRHCHESLFIKNISFFGSLSRAKALYTFNPAVLSDKTPANKSYGSKTPLELACLTNNWDAVAWLYPITPSLEVIGKSWSGLCALKDRKTIQLFYDLDPRILLVDGCMGDYGFSDLCFYNNLEIVKKFTTNWNFSELESKLAFEDGFQQACAQGHKDLIAHLYNLHPTPISYRAFTDLCYTSHRKKTTEALNYLCDIPAIKVQIQALLAENPGFKYIIDNDVQEFLKTKGIYLYDTSLGGAQASPAANPTPSSNLFEEILGVNIKPTSQLQVRKAYKKRALEVHPDKTFGSDAAFKKLSHTWGLLQLTREYKALPQS